MTQEEATTVVLDMATAYYGRDPSYPESLERQKEAIMTLNMQGAENQE